jgi:hypothetical protein
MIANVAKPAELQEVAYFWWNRSCSGFKSDGSDHDLKKDYKFAVNL